MKKIGIFLLTAIITIIFVIYGRVSGLFEKRLVAPNPPAYVKPLPEDWSSEQQRQRQLIREHIQRLKSHYDGFADHPVSQTQGIPLIILKLLPVVAPEFWGEGDDFLSVMGLFHDERLEGYPFPRGIGFTGLVRKQPHSDIDYASFSCGGCHIGRVRMPDGQYEYLDGGANSEFDVIGYRLRIVKSLQKIYAGETDVAKKKQLLIDTFLTALDSIHQQNPTYFYHNYSRGDRHFDATYEAQQIALFRQSADIVIPAFAKHQEQVYENWKIISEKFYPTIADRASQGFAGMEDALGFNAGAAYSALKQGNFLSQLLAPLALPQSHGITDIMVVWDQDSRNPRWNSDKTNLINGGGQWNGHIPLPMYKNIAAQVTLGFDDIDISVSAHSDKILDKLPPAPYPFDVNLALAKKGQALFQRHCADCHQPNNGKVYRQIGTDMGRALIAGTFITIGAQSGFTAGDTCSPTTTIELDGVDVKPCAEYRGVSLKGKSRFAMTSPRVHNGYNALPLTGLWAQAPYLHNGSVPTLYHLLIPGERPDVFIKSRLDYDTDKVGFSWNPDVESTAGKKEGYLYDTLSSPALSHQGHDQDVTDEGTTYKLDWTDDKAGALALIEYLKIL